MFTSQDVQRSIAFYELLSFELKDTHEHDGGPTGPRSRATMRNLMLARANAPIERNRQAVPL